MKICRVCKIEKPLLDFYKAPSNRDGHQGICKICDAAKRKQWSLDNKEHERATQKAYHDKHAQQNNQIARLKYAANPEIYAARNKNNYENNRETHKACGQRWREANQEKERHRKIQIRLANPKKYKEDRRKHYRGDPAQYVARAIERRIREIQAMPFWADKEAITAIYTEANKRTKNTGIQHHVDHIIPLKHKLVCGLHVPANLQILTREENLAKSNKFKIK